MAEIGRLVGQTINSRYEVKELLGKGGSGHVYRAFDISENRTVALKIFKYIGVDDSESIIRFEKEVAVYSKLQNEHCARLYDHGVSEEGFLVLAMEFLEGRSLNHVIAHEAPLEAGRAINLVCQALEALVVAHSLGIVHRDMKPDNVFLIKGPDGSEFVKVLDFGIAKFLAPESTNETLSRDGFVFGTPQYICPEQALGWQVSPASDIYSLGVVLYEMLCGTPPFQSDSPMGLGMKHIYEPPPLERLSTSDSSLRAVRALMGRMLEKRPERRPVDAGEALQEFRKLGEVPWVRFDFVSATDSRWPSGSPGVPTVKARPISGEMAVAGEEAKRAKSEPEPSSSDEHVVEIGGRKLQRLSTGGSQSVDEPGSASKRVDAPPAPPPLPSSENTWEFIEGDSGGVSSAAGDVLRSSDRMMGYASQSSGPYYEDEEPASPQPGIPAALWIVLILGLVLVGFVLYAAIMGPDPATSGPEETGLLRGAGRVAQLLDMVNNQQLWR